MESTFMPQRGHYKKLIVYQKAECIYDVTFFFAHKFLDKSDRTIDQMVRRTLWKTEHSRGKRGKRHFKGDGAEAD